jgi:CheY-like chemotaxis protein
MVKNRVRIGKPMYRLILMDFSMPFCDGPTATRKIRKFLSKTNYYPFICCLTAYTEQSFKDAAQAAGFDDYACKPVSKETLSKILRKTRLID